MSIAGRNRIRGSTVQVYRPQKLEGTGGQQARVPVKLLEGVRLELIPITDEIAVKVFGVTERIELSTMADGWTGIEKGDLFAVTAGTYAEKVFAVVAARPLGATAANPDGRFKELGLAASLETLGLPAGETP